MGAVAADTIKRALCRAGTALALSLAACSSSPDNLIADNDNVAIVTGTAPPVARAAPTAGPTPLPTVTPVPTPTSFADMHPHKSFADPPLPPELRAHVPPAPDGASSIH